MAGTGQETKLCFSANAGAELFGAINSPYISLIIRGKNQYYDLTAFKSRLRLPRNLSVRFPFLRLDLKQFTPSLYRSGIRGCVGCALGVQQVPSAGVGHMSSADVSCRD